MSIEKESLRYHETFPKGKLGSYPTKPISELTQLALAYTPGVAAPCKLIKENPKNAYLYTNKGNTVAVISNGTAVLGLGNIGPLASKPVMEGKAALMKAVAGIDSFDIEVAEENPDELVKIITAISPSFGGILLEDIKAPGCFYLEQELQKNLNIPVIHDDQHGTAITIAAGVINALKVVNKTFEGIKVVIHGAGASAIATADLLLYMGVKKSHMVMFDSKGLIHTKRKSIPSQKQPFATSAPISSLKEAMVGCDLFIGLSVADVLPPPYLHGMSDNPILFTLANPIPEIPREAALRTRPDSIIATGSSLHPNQVNNLVAYPYLLRGLLDTQATGINNAVKAAAANAIAAIVSLRSPHLTSHLTKGNLMPAPLEKELLLTVTPVIAGSIMDAELASSPISDWEAYQHYLIARRGSYLPPSNIPTPQALT